MELGQLADYWFDSARDKHREANTFPTNSEQHKDLKHKSEIDTNRYRKVVAHLLSKTK